MSQFPNQPQFGNPIEIEKALKNKNSLTSNTTDAPQNTAITKQQKGSFLFYGALAVLGYIVYKVVTTK